MAAASSTRQAASGMVMKNLVTAGSVTVTGRPDRTWKSSDGRNEPRLPRTLPNRTDARRVPRPAWAATTISATRLVAPRTLVGRAALSVDTLTKHSPPAAIAADTTFAVPRTFVLTPSAG